MYKNLFDTSMKLSEHYERSLESLEPQVLSLINRSDVHMRGEYLDELTKLNQTSIDNCVMILSKFKKEYLQDGRIQRRKRKR